MKNATNNMTHDDYITRAIQLIHSPETRNAVMCLLNGSDHVNDVSNAACLIMQAIDETNKAKAPSASNLEHVGAVVGLFAEIGEATGKFIFNESELRQVIAATSYYYEMNRDIEEQIAPDVIELALAKVTTNTTKEK
jgi:hypothetical protein